MNTLIYNIRLFFSSLRKTEYIFLLLLFFPIFYVLIFLYIFNDIDKISQKNNNYINNKAFNENTSQLSDLFFKIDPIISCNLFKGNNIIEKKSYHINNLNVYECYQKLQIEDLNVDIIFKAYGTKNSVNMAYFETNKDNFINNNTNLFFDKLIKINFNIEKITELLHKKLQNNHEGIFQEKDYEISYKIIENQLIIKIK